MDARRRARERGAEADDPHAQAAALMERVRAGELKRERLLLLAFAGHVGAKAQLVEEVAEWTAFNEVDAALDLVLGEGVEALPLASWLLGLTLFDRTCALHAMAVGLPLVLQRVSQLEPNPTVTFDYYAQEFEYEVESACQAINSALMSFMNWTATGGTPLLQSELRRVGAHTHWFRDAVPGGFPSLFELPADLCGWSRRDLEAGESRRRRRLEFEGWTTLFADLQVEFSELFRRMQGAVQDHVLEGLSGRRGA